MWLPLSDPTQLHSLQRKPRRVPVMRSGSDETFTVVLSVWSWNQESVTR